MTTVSRPLLRAVLLALALATTMVTVSAPAQAQKIKRPFFGMHDTQIAYGSTPKVTLGSVRLWDTGTRWVDIEGRTVPTILDPVPHRTYDFTRLDAAVNSARAAGLRPLVVLGQTPSYYASSPSGMPNDLSAWTDYVHAVAARYGTSVDYQIWNEPNVTTYWSGSAQQMATLTASAAQQINAAAGNAATIVGPGMPLRLSNQKAWFKQYWNKTVDGKSMASYVDVVAMHLYPSAKKGPEDSMTLLKAGRSLLPDAARKLPEWNTEVNYGLSSGGGGSSASISGGKQASYVARTLLLNAGSPIRRMYWYAWNPGTPGNTHLTSDGYRPTAAGRAWGRVSGWMLGTSFGTCSMVKSGPSKGVWTCKAKKSRKETRRFYWKPSGKAAPIKTVASTLYWTNLKGRKTSHKGSYTIKVGSSPIMVTSRR